MQDENIGFERNIFDNTLTIRIDGRAFPQAKFIKVLRTLFSLLEEIDKETSEDGEITLDWDIEAVTKGSLTLKTKSNPINANIPFSRGREVVQTLGLGLEQLSHKSQKPNGFSAKAIKSAKSLIEEIDPEDIAEIDLSSKNWGFHAFNEIAKNLIEIPLQTYSFWGAVEGKLVSLNAENKIKFGIRSKLQPKLINVFVGDDEVLFQKAVDAIRKRVYIYGEIRQWFGGEKVNIKAREIKVFPDDSEIPTSSEILRMLGV
jgi:hypothetical protein